MMNHERELDIHQLEESQFAGTESREPESIDTIVIHSMHNPNPPDGDKFSAESCRSILNDNGVSAHYIVDRAGEIWRLVPEDRMAWHAGKSKMPDDGREKVNKFSIGVELSADFVGGFTDEQYQAISLLAADISSRYPIRYIVGHNDIASESVRPKDPKTDPWEFNWYRFRNDLEELLGNNSMPTIRSAQFE